MSVNRLLNNYWFCRVILAVWIVSAVFVIFLLLEIDRIVHVQLYSFGLQFSPDWANPYWIFARLIYVCMGLPMALSVFVLAYGLLRKVDKPKNSKAMPETEKETVLKDPNVTKQGSPHKSASNGKLNVVISCPSCKKVFSRPLLMLDFSKKRNRLVSVCPYCNHVLGDVENEKEKDSVEVTDLDEKMEIH